MLCHEKPLQADSLDTNPKNIIIYTVFIIEKPGSSHPRYISYLCENFGISDHYHPESANEALT